MRMTLKAAQDPATTWSDAIRIRPQDAEVLLWSIGTFPSTRRTALFMTGGRIRLGHGPGVDDQQRLVVAVRRITGRGGGGATAVRCLRNGIRLIGGWLPGRKREGQLAASG